jgi:hypothetical protein
MALRQDSHIQQRIMARLKSRAFAVNQLAKMSRNEARAGFYRAKAAAINAALESEYAFADDIDWSLSDPIFFVRYVDGGGLHTRLSCLDSAALRAVRRQLNGYPTPQEAVAGSRGFSSLCERRSPRTAAALMAFR